MPPQTAARTIGTTDRLGSLCKTVPTGRLLAVRPKPDSGNGDKELRKEIKKYLKALDAFEGAAKIYG